MVVLTHSILNYSKRKSDTRRVCDALPVNLPHHPANQEIFKSIFYIRAQKGINEQIWTLLGMSIGTASFKQELIME